MLTEQTNEISIRAGASKQQTRGKSLRCKIISFQKNLGANEYRKDRRINGLQLVGILTLLIFFMFAMGDF